MTDAGTPEPPEQADRLRAALVDGLHAQGVLPDAAVEAAMRAVPRHLFLPGVPLEQAYANRPVVLKRDARGGSMSSVSQPGVVAAMLGQLQPRHGHRVLEIGSGGYNAALLAELVGPQGSVLSLDIDPEVVERARDALAGAGHPGVELRCADGEYGAPGHAPFDRVIVTVGAWDLAPAWLEQLHPAGRLVVPLRLRGLTRSIAFEPDGDHLAGRSALPCGFVPMQGAGAHHEQQLPIDTDVLVGVDAGTPLDAAALSGVLAGPRRERWTGVRITRYTDLSELDLWLACAEPGYAVLRVGPAAPAGLAVPALGWGGSAVLGAASLAYLAARPGGGSGQLELGGYGHGPQAAELVERLVEQVRRWDRGQRGGPGPRIDAWPAGTPDARLPPATVLAKRHVRLTVRWPEGESPGPAT